MTPEFGQKTFAEMGQRTFQDSEEAFAPAAGDPEAGCLAA
jgi:hypothetical protein